MKVRIYFIKKKNSFKNRPNGTALNVISYEKNILNTLSQEKRHKTMHKTF